MLALRKADAERRFDQTKTILIFGTILGLLITAAAGWSVWRDSSRRGRAEEALQDSQERYRMLLDEVRDHAIVMMDPQGKIVTWNAGAEQIQGYSADEIIGREFFLFLSSRGYRARQAAGDTPADRCQWPARRTWHARAERRLAIPGEYRLHGVA